MKKLIFSLIAFCFFFFLPVFCPVSFASDFDIEYLQINPVSVDDIDALTTFTLTSSYNEDFYKNNYLSTSQVLSGRSYTVSSVGDKRYCLVFFKTSVDGSFTDGYLYRYDGSVSLSTYNRGFYYSTYRVNTTTSGTYWIYNPISLSCPVPMFLASTRAPSSSSGLSGIDTNDDWYIYLTSGELQNSLNVIGHGYEGHLPLDLGYLDEVQYYVDSFAYHNDTANTPEWVKWGSTSTSGIDLSDSRYQVEFMMEDKSTFLRNGANDSWLTQSGVPFASAVAFAESKLEYAASYLFPSGSDQRALLQGKAAKTSLYGKASGLGSVPASLGVYKFSVASQYKAALENDSSADKGVLYNLISDILSNQGNVAEKFFNSYQASGKALNFTYDLYARIVDASSGTSGNWLKIDRHNSPFEWSNNDRFLNGGVTVSKGHRFINYNPETYVFKTLPDDDPVDDDDIPLPDGDPALTVPVGTGYVDNSDNSIQNVYNNYNYTYNTFYDNDLFYTDLDGKNKDTGSGMIETIGILGLLGILWTWYLALFGDLLPLWAVVLVPVFGTLFVAFLVWKFGKGLLP